MISLGSFSGSLPPTTSVPSPSYGTGGCAPGKKWYFTLGLACVLACVKIYLLCSAAPPQQLERGLSLNLFPACGSCSLTELLCLASVGEDVPSPAAT